MILCSIGEAIKSLRVQNKVTQRELADRLGVSSQLISKWESGLAHPDVSHISVIAGIFKVSVVSILTGEVCAKVSDNLVKSGNIAVVHDFSEVLTQLTLDKLFDTLKREPAKRNRVLVADDAAFMRAHIRAILTQNDYEVVAEAENGYDVIEAIETTFPDIVIMDIVMPELDGISALRRIKRIAPQTAVIICSSMASQKVILEAIEAGASWFIIKPFIPEQFILTVKKLS